MIHSWDNSPSISLSFKLAFVVPRRCINALALKSETQSHEIIRLVPMYESATNRIHIGQGINYWGLKSHSILIL